MTNRDILSVDLTKYPKLKTWLDRQPDKSEAIRWLIQRHLDDLSVGGELKELLQDQSGMLEEILSILRKGED